VTRKGILTFMAGCSTFRLGPRTVHDKLGVFLRLRRHRRFCIVRYRERVNVFNCKNVVNKHGWAADVLD
jgi:hypothetical protein